eukprot:Lithocolla_globosa_v1_NODE_139_length_5801_cov_6.461364.p5 type:complete len:132 gc:universal NODE_139_length_5801_cov_6.461364:2263-2658(+)
MGGKKLGLSRPVETTIFCHVPIVLSFVVKARDSHENLAEGCQNKIKSVDNDQLSRFQFGIQKVIYHMVETTMKNNSLWANNAESEIQGFRLVFLILEFLCEPTEVRGCSRLYRQWCGRGSQSRLPLKRTVK